RKLCFLRFFAVGHDAQVCQEELNLVHQLFRAGSPFNPILTGVPICIEQALEESDDHVARAGKKGGRNIFLCRFCWFQTKCETHTALVLTEAQPCCPLPVFFYRWCLPKMLPADAPEFSLHRFVLTRNNKPRRIHSSFDMAISHYGTQQVGKIGIQFNSLLLPRNGCRNQPPWLLDRADGSPIHKRKPEAL